MFLSVLYVIGITAEAMTAALSAGREKMDLFGVLLLAALTALGGGTVRDMILGNYPLTWVEHPKYLIIVLCAAVVTVSLPFLMQYFHTLFLLADAVGLAVFAVLGTKIALELGHGVVIAMVASVVTGVFGGILRDLMSDRVPLVFSSELYAAIAVLATCVYVILGELGVAMEINAVISVCTAFVARLLAIKFNSHLPTFEHLAANQPVDPRLRLSARLVRDRMRTASRSASRMATRTFRLDTLKYSKLSNSGHWVEQGTNSVDGAAFTDNSAAHSAKASRSQQPLPKQRPWPKQRPDAPKGQTWSIDDNAESTPRPEPARDERWDC